ncbi:MAG TPA: 4-(cytidine 5'-diphospho)-2-C-methyl-D-erythritol kinase [Bacteroidales bacterium]|mgnify:CR=1 FL=1|nr:4-(cytidine 5'-diphospho)-2-C-methyl-D-erythritol kinase [Bacteroidales bacterium]
MIVYPNCKINLGLNVVSKRPDGFHNIESILYPIPWFDILEIIPSKKNNFLFDGIQINCPETENLCFKAHQLLQKQKGIPEINLYLYKNIPSGAGLGGGSSDGAFTLRALNDLFSLNLDEETLRGSASNLGSDCPFFIQDQPCLVTGTGNILMPLPATLKGYYIVVIKPDISISTKEAYGMVTPKKAQKPLTEIIKLPVRDWKNLMVNDFEEPIFKKYPKINSIKKLLYEKGAIYASMSGSGSAVYGLFENKIDMTGDFQDCIFWNGRLA